MKLYVMQIADGTPSIVSEWTDNEKGAIVSFHQTCANLYNDTKTTKAIVRLVDENFNTYIGDGADTYREYGGFEEVIDKTLPEITFKITVMSVVNGNLDLDGITEWTTRKGAMVKFHQRCAALWNAGGSVTATVKVLNEKLEMFESKTEKIAY